MSAAALSGAGFNAATGGDACNGNVDFVSFANVPFSIPARAAATTVLSGTISIAVLGDGRRENNETFFVELASSVNATIADGTGQATIRDTTLSIGGFDLSPDNASVEVDETLVYTVGWTVPDTQKWRSFACRRRLPIRVNGGVDHGTVDHLESSVTGRSRCCPGGWPDVPLAMFQGVGRRRTRSMLAAIDGVGAARITR